MADDLIRTILVDDQEMFAEGVSRVLAREHNIDVIGTAATVRDAIALARDVQPTVAVVDYQLPDGTGSDVATAIRRVSPHTRVLILTGLGDEASLLSAIEAGCSGFVTKDRAVAELVEAIRLAVAGEAYIDPKVLAGVLPRMAQPRRGIGADLSRREREILDLLSEGMSTQAIGEHLFLSLHTVRNHVRNLLSKLNAHSKLEAVAIAKRDGLLAG